VIRRRSQGFTLIEMSVVVLVIAILAMLVIPRLIVSKNEDDYRKSFQNIESLANASRDLAITSGRTYVLSFDSEEQTLTASPEDVESAGSTTAQPNDDEEAAGESRTAKLGKDWSVSETTNQNDQSSESQLSIRFFSDGTAESRDAKFMANDVEVHLTVDTSGNITVRRGQAETTTQTEWEAGELEQRTS
jgi:prepilin-type N-terminal cleavage/methylation domain-containing protein